jgi:hypothetical protein
MSTRKKRKAPAPTGELPPEMSVSDLLPGDDDLIQLGDAPPDRPPDPLAGLVYTGNAEVDSAGEAEGVKTAFLQRSKAERARFVAATDSEYWFAVCFQSREQKEAFLRAMKWLGYGDKYLDGTKVARRQGISLPEASVPFLTEKPDLTDLALPLEG